MATAAASPAAIGRGISYWRRLTQWVARHVDRGLAAGSSVWVYARAKTTSAWAWSKFKGASALAATRKALWVGVGYVLFAANWVWNMALTGVSIIGSTAAWIIGGILSLAGAAFGILGWGGLLLVFGVTMLLLAGSNLIHDYVVVPFNWLRRPREDDRGLRHYVMDARGDRVLDETTADLTFTSGHIFRLNDDLTDDLPQDGSLTKLPVSLDRATPAEAKEVDTYPVMALMIAKGIRLPVLYDWSEVLYNDDIDVMAHLEHLASEAVTKREKSYWEGRKMAYATFGSADERLVGQDIQKAWALNAQRHRGDQKPFNPRYYKAGFTDMSTEIQQAQARLAEEELVSN